MKTPPPTDHPNQAKAGRYLTFSLGAESYGLPVLNEVTQSRACDILEDQIVASLKATAIKDRDDVRMRNRGHQTCFALKASSSFFGGRLGENARRCSAPTAVDISPQHFDRDQSIKTVLPTEEHFTHAATTQVTQHREPRDLRQIRLTLIR